MSGSGPDITTCDDVRDALALGPSSAPGLEAHVASCAPCAEIAASPELVGLLAPAPGEHLSDGLARSITERVQATKLPPRRRLRMVGATFALIGVGLLFGLARPRPDLAAVPVLPAALLVAGFALAVALGTWLVARPPWKTPLGGTRRHVALAALVALPVLAVLVPLSEPTGLGAFAIPTLACLGYGSTMVVLSVGVLGATFRHDTLLGARWPLAAATGAVLANISLVLHCPMSDAGHLMASHVGLGLLAAATAALGSVLSPSLSGAAPR